MKLTNVIYAGVALATLSLSACSNDLDKNSEWGDNGIRFTSYIAGPVSRLVNGANVWDAGDKVGIFMPAAGQPIAGNQAQYTADAKGALTADGTALDYPQDGSSVDFIAYYPYDANAKGTTNVDVPDQSKNIDLVYAKEPNHKKGDATVNLGFKHQLSYVVLNVSGKDGASVAGLAVALQGTKTAGTFDLNAGSLTTTDNSVKDIKFNTISNGTEYGAIVLPATSLTGAKLAFTLGGKTETEDLPANVTSFAAGTKYTINVTISGGSSTPGGDFTVSFGGATISDWTESVGGDLNVDFGGGSETPDPEPQPGVETTIFSETFGTENPASGTSSYVGNFTGYDNYGKVTYSNPDDGKANIRQTKQIADNHLWLPANYDNGLLISGINTAGYKTLKLIYDICPNTYGKTDTGNANAIVVKWNGTPLTVGDHPFTNEDNNKFITITITDGLVAADDATLEFYGAGSTNTIGYRIDNIKLVGTK